MKITYPRENTVECIRKKLWSRGQLHYPALTTDMVRILHVHFAKIFDTVHVSRHTCRHMVVAEESDRSVSNRFGTTRLVNNMPKCTTTG